MNSNPNDDFKSRTHNGRPAQPGQFKIDGLLSEPLDNAGQPTFSVEVVNGLTNKPAIQTNLGPLEAVDPVEGQQLARDFGQIQQGVLLEGPINEIGGTLIYRLTYWLKGNDDPEKPIEVTPQPREYKQEHVLTR
jgi:hypothetical protein